MCVFFRPFSNIILVDAPIAIPEISRENPQHLADLGIAVVVPPSCRIFVE
jgi:hypothetical protein